MAQVRLFACLLVLLIIVGCALARPRDSNDVTYREKRFFLSCGKVGKKCVGLMAKSCCNGFKCNSTSGKCVSNGSSGSWLNDRNGK